ncbi:MULTISPECIES: hypothetical protein [unclassified Streptomyces]|uniref:hypothetical protein n=1 Tax=unclassified Streptomyces TaxID=2593676 RepID=UPI002255C20F|nr:MULTISPECIES: hypothetical protein [unclassified Streptomyces]MCX5336400.1 hypothetical protein [Streptomyces sp. NBC_00140]MCX5367122.1 hypothetical protein [Streptomyces sp. NBC_00124]
MRSALAVERSVRTLFDTAVDQLGGVDGRHNVAADASASALRRRQGRTRTATRTPELSVD